MNRQEVFNRAYLGILAQGCPSLRSGMCAYRGVGDVKCAIGHNIPDKKYNFDFEGRSPNYLLNRTVGSTISKLIGCQTQDDVAFARRLQRVHDSLAAIIKPNDKFIYSFKEEMTIFATEHGLEVPYALQTL